MNKILEIDDQKYLVNSLSPTKAWKMGIKLTKMIGEPVAAMARAAGDDGKAAEAFQPAVRSLLDNLDPDESMAMIKELLAGVEIQGEQKAMITSAVFELHFNGKMGHLLKLVSEVIEFQFADFFAAMGDAIASMTTREKTA